jgi:hypothetical protein
VLVFNLDKVRFDINLSLDFGFCYVPPRRAILHAVVHISILIVVY